VPGPGIVPPQATTLGQSQAQGSHVSAICSNPTLTTVGQHPTLGQGQHHGSAPSARQAKVLLASALVSTRSAHESSLFLVTGYFF